MQEKTFKKTCKKHQKTIETRCRNRPKTAMTPKIDEKRFSALSPRPPFFPQVDFWWIFGSRPAPKRASGTRPERFKSFVNLGGVSKTVPTGSWEPPGRLSGGFRAPPGSPGAPFWDNFLLIFEVVLTCKVTVTFYFLHLHFFSDPSLRRVTLIRATEELLINK